MTTGTEQSGLAALFGLHREELRRFLRARCGDDCEANDVLQDLWIKLREVPAGPIANGRAYLFRMANNLVLDHRRAQMRAMQRDRAWISQDGEAAAPEMRPDPSLPADEAIVRQQEARILQQAIEDLPHGARRALLLFRFEERSQAEIAQIMGISRSGVEKHLAVAMKHLRNALADCGSFAFAASQEKQGIRAEQVRMDEDR
jgi:RNA polymerase sigma-70 factor (ECF subfamily)